MERVIRMQELEVEISEFYKALQTVKSTATRHEINRYILQLAHELISLQQEESVSTDPFEGFDPDINWDETPFSKPEDYTLEDFDKQWSELVDLEPFPDECPDDDSDRARAFENLPF